MWYEMADKKQWKRYVGYALFHFLSNSIGNARCSVIVLTTAAAFPMLYDRKRNSAYPTYLFHCFLSAISYHTNFLLSISYEFNHKKYVVLILNHKFPC